jgi:hypothetical protein
MNSAEDLAADLGVDEGDVAVLLTQFGQRPPDVSDEAAAFLRRLLDPHEGRTLPPSLFWPNVEDEPRRMYGLGGPDTTRPGNKR